MRRGGAAFVALALSLALGAAACGTTAPRLAPGQLLASAQAALNATPSVHFSITSSGDTEGSGVTVTGGTGSLVRPAGLTGTFELDHGGLPLTIGIEAEGAKFYVKLPFFGYQAANPAKYGLVNPELLLSRTHGLTAILAGVRDGRSDGTTRLSGELLDKVSGSVPGTDIPVIPDVAPSRPVAVVAEIDPTTRQLRQVTLTGPFVSASASTTYVVTITDYGQPVNISLPTS
jgi:lipoprotein LprG